MACKNRSKVYLGYEDEFITDKHRSLVNFTTNKLGGKPDVHSKNSHLAAPICHLCGKHQLLAVQVYAPLDNSIYHRTLYIFACVNPNCWNQHDSWTCLRVESLEENSKITSSSVSPSLTISPVTNWLSTADDWGDETCDNMQEDNGNNNICVNDSSQLNLYTKSCDIDDELNDDLSDLCLNDQNANSPASMESPVGGGAVGRLESPQESAEIEGEESEVVCIDTPTQPQCNVMDLFNRVNSNPFQYHGQSDFLFREVFLSVEEEEVYNDVPQHVRDLFLEYQRGNPDGGKIDSPQAVKEAKSIDTQPEKYEKSVPKHGDEMFHNFVDRIQMNPQQLLRYCRDNSAPLLPRPLPMSIGPCKYCKQDRIFELQILPTIIPKLKIANDRDFELEFGTVLVFTCSKSCWSLGDTFKEELIIVQAEKFK